MVSPSLREFLDARHIAYRVLPHEPRFTAQETAAAAHVPGRRFAKVVLLEGEHGAGADFLLAALPATEEIDLARLGREIQQQVHLAPERDFERVCPEFEPGAAPPFSELTHLPVYADRCLARGGTIAFNGGTHADLVEMRWDDFERLAKPQLLDYGRLPTAPMPTARMP